MNVRIKRVYDDPTPDDGFRVLVDRLWPRGISKDRAQVGVWLKEVAPSAELRKQFHHEGATFEEFASLYRAELVNNVAVAELRTIVATRPVVTLLVGARDVENNQATVLLKYLGESPESSSEPDQATSQPDQPGSESRNS